MLTGIAGNPAVTSQGDTVRAQLGTSSADIEVVGPNVPGEGLPYVTSATTCTWTVTFRAASGDVPINVSDFSTVDGLGHRYKLRLVAGQPRPPSHLSSGQRAKFDLRTVMATGEGVMQWAPNHGPLIAVWDFVVEND